MTIAEPGGPTLGAVAALGSALTWALIGLVARALIPYFNVLSINMIRSAVGGVLLAVVVLASGSLGALGAVSPTSWVYLTVSVITAFAIGDTAFFESTKTIGLARAMSLSMLYPLLASALGFWFLGERITPFVAAGAVVTLGGLVLIVGERAPVTSEAPDGRSRGLALALLAALAFAVSVALTKPVLHEVDPVSVQAVRLPLAAVLLWLTPWARGAGRQVRAHLRAAGPLLLLHGVLTAISAVTFVTALKYADLALATVLSSTSPLFALPIGFLVFGERATWRAVLGVLLCVGGIALLSL
ncbi:MAG: DMT family transporter [Candidatus Rokuibacteriota bacterium]